SPADTKIVRSWAKRGEGRTTSANGTLLPVADKVQVRPSLTERYTPTPVAAKMSVLPSVVALARPATSPPGLSASRSQSAEGSGIQGLTARGGFLRRTRTSADRASLAMLRPASSAARATESGSTRPVLHGS